MGRPIPTGRNRLNSTFAQAFAVALVAVFSYATGRVFFHMPESYWAPIAAVVVLYPEAKATRSASIDRFLGTLIGCLVGWGSGDLVAPRRAALRTGHLCRRGGLLAVATGQRLSAVRGRHHSHHTDSTGGAGPSGRVLPLCRGLVRSAVRAGLRAGCGANRNLVVNAKTQKARLNA